MTRLAVSQRGEPGTLSLEWQQSRSKNTALWRFVRNWRAVVGSLVLSVFIGMALFAPVIAPFEPERQFIVDRLSSPNETYRFGTDQLGRDVFSRTLYASRVSMTIGILAMLVSVSIGVTIGVASGYFGGLVDNVLMRLTEVLLAFPLFFLLLTVTTLFGRNIEIIILLLGLTSWGVVARVVRGQVLSLKEQDFVEAARSIGASHFGIISRHIMPNVIPIIIVDATLRVALLILIEGGLSFLGVGIPPPTPSWGNMVAEGNSLLRRALWVSVYPGLCLFLCTMAFNLVGDGLRDALDPHFSR